MNSFSVASIHYPSREYVMNSISVSHITMDTVFFRQFTTNLLYIVYNWPNSTKWPFLDNIGPFLNSGDFLWHYLTSNNLEFKFSTKFWVKTYVYLIYFDQPARFDPYWTGLTRARGTDFVRLRPASASVRFLRNLPVRRPNPSLKRTNEVRPPSASVLEADGVEENLPSVVLHRPASASVLGRPSPSRDPWVWPEFDLWWP